MRNYSFQIIPLDNEPLVAPQESDDAAWGKAVVYVGEVLQSMDGALDNHADFTLELKNDEGRLLATLHVTADRRR
jgi:hypothetical protein